MKITEKFKNINKTNEFERCKEIQKIVQAEGDFGYSKINEIIADLDDEIIELKEEIFLENNLERIGNEFGDVLFVLCNLADKLDLDIEKVLKSSTDEFQRRITYIEDRISGKYLKDLTKEEQKSLWKEAKMNK